MINFVNDRVTGHAWEGWSRGWLIFGERATPSLIRQLQESVVTDLERLMAGTYYNRFSLPLVINVSQSQRINVEPPNEDASEFLQFCLLELIHLGGHKALRRCICGVFFFGKASWRNCLKCRPKRGGSNATTKKQNADRVQRFRLRRKLKKIHALASPRRRGDALKAEAVLKPIAGLEPYRKKSYRPRQRTETIVLGLGEIPRPFQQWNASRNKK